MREAGGFRMGPFELMDLIGHDVNFAVTQSVWEAYLPRSALHAVGAAARAGRRGLPRPQVGARLLRVRAGRGEPAPQTEAPGPRPARVVVHGDPGIAAPLVARLAAAGVAVEHARAGCPVRRGALRLPAPPATPGSCLSDGRTATARAAAAGVRDLVVFDLALDYAHGDARSRWRAPTAARDAAARRGRRRAAGGGLAVSRIDDVPGLVVLRTVAMLANEAADARGAGRRRCRRRSTSRCRRASTIRAGRSPGPTRSASSPCATCWRISPRHYGDDRYRMSPLIARAAR